MENSASQKDLIFTSQPNLVNQNFGFHPSLCTTCHHKTVYCKLNLKIKFKIAKTRKSIEQFHWENMFNHKNCH